MKQTMKSECERVYKSLSASFPQTWRKNERCRNQSVILRIIQLDSESVSFARSIAIAVFTFMFHALSLYRFMFAVWLLTEFFAFPLPFPRRCDYIFWAFVMHSFMCLRCFVRLPILVTVTIAILISYVSSTLCHNSITFGKTWRTKQFTARFEKTHTEHTPIHAYNSVESEMGKMIWWKCKICKFNTLFLAALECPCNSWNLFTFTILKYCCS